jgi:hypothetical protein
MPNRKTSFHCDDYRLAAANIGISSNNVSGASTMRISANGSEDNGMVQINANGGVEMRAGDARFNVNGEGSGAATVDGGAEGIAAMVSGNPAVPQTIILNGETMSIKIQNGPLPICPMIEVTPEMIRLGVGTSGIEITAEGVTINGLQVAISGLVEASLSGAMVSVEGEAMTTVSGALVQVN